jgi:cytochrome c-type biogenesis protein CcmE
MKAKPIKIAATALVLMLGFTGLLYSTLRDGTEYYKHVDEVMSDPSVWQGKRLQLHGYIVDGSILQKPNTLQYRFQVQSNGKVVHAEYTGIVPDGFKSGSEVVLKGRLNQEHGFSVEPGGVMAKCPSKYVAGPPVPGTKS